MIIHQIAGRPSFLLRAERTLVRIRLEEHDRATIDPRTAPFTVLVRVNCAGNHETQKLIVFDYIHTYIYTI